MFGPLIYDPSYGIGPSSSEMLPDSALTVTLPSIGNATFLGLLGMFNRIGLYRVVVHAQDVNGLRAQPVSFDVRTGWVVYLPQITK